MCALNIGISSTFGGEGTRDAISLTIMTTCSRPFARARSPIFSQYWAEVCSSPSIMVEPWEKKCTGAILPPLLFPTAILWREVSCRYSKASSRWLGGVLLMAEKVTAKPDMFTVEEHDKE